MAFKFQGQQYRQDLGCRQARAVDDGIDIQRLFCNETQKPRFFFRQGFTPGGWRGLGRRQGTGA